MTPSPISTQVREFIATHLDSVEMLQVLVLLHESPDRDWSAAEITRELRSAESSIEKRLRDLHAHRILVRVGEGGQHRYCLAEESPQPVIRELVETFRVTPYGIIELIYARPNPSLQAFADAFKIKKEED